MKKDTKRSALIKQHRVVFEKRHSFSYAVSPFYRSASKTQEEIFA